ncbi:MAG TPA: diguanylate cyclase [Gaiellaceae bacterium]|nr:diguanylate cyclase [Gaiellaceae bacterium]
MATNATAPLRADEHLVAEARDRRAKRPSTRDLWTSVALGGSFVAVAIAIAAMLPSERAPSLFLVALLVGAYALLSRVELEVGPGAAVPTQLVFVSMLFIVPLPLVPLCVAAGYVLGALPEYLGRRLHPARLPVLVGSSWFAIGPTVVLALFAADTPTWRDAPIYVAALAAQFGLDFTSSAVRARVVFGHATRTLLPSFAWAGAVDAFLAVAGLGAVVGETGAFLVMVSFAALLALLARDRRVRIDRAVAFDRAYRGALDEAHRDELTGLGNRRKLLADLERAFAEADGSGDQILVIYDLNGFKYYNDSFGHPAGDVLLQRLARKLAGAVEGCGSSYRLGGDEFCVLAAVPTDTVEALIDATTAALSEEGDGFSISTCFGAVFLPSEAADSSAALRKADQRLYAQKHATKLGRGRPHEVLLEALFERDPELREHVHDVAHLCAAVGTRLGLHGDALEELIIAAQLHDVGKIGIPDAVLHKRGPLDEGELTLIRQHTVIGQRILAAAPTLHGVGTIVRATHERWDGEGYVDGLIGDAIPLAARVIAVCDTFAAITSDRPYRAAMTVEQAFRELRRCAGTQFDPEVVRVFCDEVGLAEASRLVPAEAA